MGNGEGWLNLGGGWGAFRGGWRGLGGSGVEVGLC